MSAFKFVEWKTNPIAMLSWDWLISQLDASPTDYYKNKMIQHFVEKSERLKLNYDQFFEIKAKFKDPERLEGEVIVVLCTLLEDVEEHLSSEKFWLAMLKNTPVQILWIADDLAKKFPLIPLLAHLSVLHQDKVRSASLFTILTSLLQEKEKQKDKHVEKQKEKQKENEKKLQDGHGEKKNINKNFLVSLNHFVLDIRPLSIGQVYYVTLGQSKGTIVRTGIKSLDVTLRGNMIIVERPPESTLSLSVKTIGKKNTTIVKNKDSVDFHQGQPELGEEPELGKESELGKKPELRKEKTRVDVEESESESESKIEEEEIEKKMTQIQITNKCVSCLEALNVGVFTPCGHQCTCMDCGSKMQTCPICRKPGLLLHIENVDIFTLTSQKIFDQGIEDDDDNDNIDVDTAASNSEKLNSKEQKELETFDEKQKHKLDQEQEQEQKKQKNQKQKQKQTQKLKQEDGQDDLKTKSIKTLEEIASLILDASSVEEKYAVASQYIPHMASQYPSQSSIDILRNFITSFFPSSYKKKIHALFVAKGDEAKSRKKEKSTTREARTKDGPSAFSGGTKDKWITIGAGSKVSVYAEGDTSARLEADVAPNTTLSIHSRE